MKHFVLAEETFDGRDTGVDEGNIDACTVRRAIVESFKNVLGELSELQTGERVARGECDEVAVRAACDTRSCRVSQDREGTGESQHRKRGHRNDAPPTGAPVQRMRHSDPHFSDRRHGKTPPIRVLPRTSVSPLTPRLVRQPNTTSWINASSLSSLQGRQRHLSPSS